MSGGNQGGAPGSSGQAGNPAGAPGPSGMTPDNPYYINRPGASAPADSPYAAGAPNTGNMDYLPGFASGQAQRSRDPGNNFDASKLFGPAWQEQFGRSQYGDAYGQAIEGGAGATIGGNAPSFAGSEFDWNALGNIVDTSQYGGVGGTLQGRRADLVNIHAPVYNQYAQNALYKAQQESGFGGPAAVRHGGDVYWFRGTRPDGTPIYDSPATGRAFNSYDWLQSAMSGGPSMPQAGGGAPMGSPAPMAQQAQMQPNSLYSMPAGGIGSPNPYEKQGPLYGVI